MNSTYLKGVILFVLIASFFFYGATKTHRASEIDPGTFVQGDYFFPGTSKVGVGTTSATAALEASNAEGGKVLRLNSGPNAVLDIIPEANSRTVLHTVNNRHIILNAGTGNIGIGLNTTPSAKLHIGTGNFRTDGSICFGTTCRSAWPGEGPQQMIVLLQGVNTCPAGKVVVGVRYDGGGDDHAVGIFCR